jgi:multiple sugar transport system permease protein
MFDRDTGMLNQLLVNELHLVHARPFWLIGDNAFWVTVIVAVWRLWPFAYLMIAAALRTVPTELYDAATVDGAGAWQQFRRVTLPATHRANTLVVAVMALWSLTDFSTPYLLFDSTPPPSADLLGNLIYRTAFADFNLGVAAALNVAVAILLLLLAGPAAWRLLPKAAADA